MFDDVPQNHHPVSQAQLVHPSYSKQQREWQDTSRCQGPPESASTSYGSPRVPDSARVPSQIHYSSSDFLQPTKIPRAHQSPRERSEQDLSQANPLHNKQMESGNGHLGQESPRHILRDLEKGYSEQSPRRSSAHSPSQPHHTTIYYEKDETQDESAAEEHSVWILVSSPYVA